MNPDVQSHFYSLLVEDVHTCTKRLEPQAAALIKRYYAVLETACESSHGGQPASGLTNRAAFARYNWIRRTTPMVDLLSRLPIRERPWKVLDAGCGLGTEALFWSSLREDIEVVGVDVAAERLQAARDRLDYFETHLDKKLKVEFRNQNVFKLLKDERFDLIWTMEAISHIDPAEDFISLAGKWLPKPGFLIISDSHRLNPKMLWRIFKLRKQNVTVRVEKEFIEDEVIQYAQERLFSIRELNTLVQKAGFDSISSQLSIFFPPAIFTSKRFSRAAAHLDTLLDRIPMVRNFGGIYTLMARKGSGVLIE